MGKEIKNNYRNKFEVFCDFVFCFCNNNKDWWCVKCLFFKGFGIGWLILVFYWMLILVLVLYEIEICW